VRETKRSICSTSSSSSSIDHSLVRSNFPGDREQDEEDVRVATATTFGVVVCVCVYRTSTL
jgi:hypothetical protein